MRPRIPADSHLHLRRIEGAVALELRQRCLHTVAALVAIVAYVLMGAIFSKCTASYQHWPAFEAKCKKEGLNDAAISAFKYNYEKLASGANLMIPESDISPVASLPAYEYWPCIWGV